MAGGAGRPMSLASRPVTRAPGVCSASRAVRPRRGRNGPLPWGSELFRASAIECGLQFVLRRNMDAGRPPSETPASRRNRHVTPDF